MATSEWDCAACTFAGNPTAVLCCTVCGTPKEHDDAQSVADVLDLDVGGGRAVDVTNSGGSNSSKRRRVAHVHGSSGDRRKGKERASRTVSGPALAALRAAERRLNGPTTAATTPPPSSPSSASPTAL